MNSITRKYTKTTKMSELIEADYRMLLLLSRLGISLGFGEMSIQAICKKYDIDADCFLFMANLQTNRSVYDYRAEFEKIGLDSVLLYLQKSHSYFIDRRLPHFRNALQNAISNLETNVQKIILRFFDDYSNEVNEHMQYENDTAFPYIFSLLGVEVGKDYNITVFEDHHSDIEGKMAELSRILTKYIQGDATSLTMTNVLIELHIIQEELDSHTFIEEELVIPRVKKIEGGKARR